MKQTVAAYIAKTLESAGVKRIWGVTGDSLNGLSDSLNRMGTIEWMSTRHEEVAAFAAGAEAQLSGELAVCAGSCGPGNLHLINGLFDCHRNHVPVLAIAAHIPSSEIGSGYFQETHPQELFRECSHYCELVSSPEQIPQVLAIAMRKAVLNRGVSVGVKTCARRGNYPLISCATAGSNTGRRRVTQTGATAALFQQYRPDVWQRLRGGA